MLEYTRAPQYMSLWWRAGEPADKSPFGPDLVPLLSTQPPAKKPDCSEVPGYPNAADAATLRDRYGMVQAPSGYMQQSVATLLDS
ncbi:hypothetical protein ACFWUZ_35250 [Streptomyces sp. NPDC058646]|uniref:hypothetical protein n=1 Tax=Streptomyces sp. NPDC058646 TaxID=3346574 RepID=UPI00365B4B7E